MLTSHLPYCEHVFKGPTYNNVGRNMWTCHVEHTLKSSICQCACRYIHTYVSIQVEATDYYYTKSQTTTIPHYVDTLIFSEMWDYIFQFPPLLACCTQSDGGYHFLCSPTHTIFVWIIMCRDLSFLKRSS